MAKVLHFTITSTRNLQPNFDKLMVENIIKVRKVLDSIKNLEYEIFEPDCNREFITKQIYSYKCEFVVRHYTDEQCAELFKKLVKANIQVLTYNILGVAG